MATKLIPYLVLDGNANEAISFYVEALDAQLLFSTTFGDMPQNPEYPLPEEAKGLVAHATIKVGESELMFSDTFPGQPATITGNQVTICITLDNEDKSKQIFEALSQGGQVAMPLQATDFSPAYGIVADKFGVTFQVYTEGQK